MASGLGRLFGRKDGPVPGNPTELRVEPVRTARDRLRFIEYPLALYKGVPQFVAPIVAERKDFLDPQKNPFLQHAELELFLARRGDTVVGRAAAIYDPHYNQFHNAEYGFFGMFDAVDDEQVAAALLDACAASIRRRGMKALLGPVNLSFNNECGLLVEGFDYPPAMMMPYNFPYYARLLEANGFQKAKDLWSYDLSTSIAPPERVVRVAEKIREQEGIVVRPIDLKNLHEEIRRIKSVYDAMLDRIFGFVPMTDAEFDQIAARLRPLVQIRSELCLIAESRGEPVAFSLTFPDANVALRPAEGHLTQYGLPLGLAKMAWAARNIDRLRVLLFGIKPGYRRRGLDAILYLDTLRAARQLGYTGGELGWTTEDNDLMNRAIESMGARRYKVYRIYERPV